MDISTFITEDRINSMREKYGHLYEFDYYKDGSVDVLDLKGNYVTTFYDINDCMKFEMDQNHIT